MKIMKCKELGGPCDMEMIANSPEEMIKRVEEHANIAHVDLIKQFNNMTMEENMKWNNSIIKKWNDKPEINTGGEFHWGETFLKKFNNGTEMSMRKIF